MLGATIITMDNIRSMYLLSSCNLEEEEQEEERQQQKNTKNKQNQE
jgi:hypothetical protein